MMSEEIKNIILDIEQLTDKDFRTLFSKLKKIYEKMKQKGVDKK